MPFSFPPCPVCGGTQAFFEGSVGPAGITISLGTTLFSKDIQLGALICMNCSHTELRPHPGDMPQLRAIAEKRGPLPD